MSGTQQDNPADALNHPADLGCYAIFLMEIVKP
jgi:hypothetical protein